MGLFAAGAARIVIVVAPAPEEKPSADSLDEALKLALEHYSPSDAAKQLAQMFGLPRKLIYEKALALKGHDRG